MDFTIVEQEAASFLFSWSGPDRETSGDTWHTDIEAAMIQAQSSFGIEPQEWQVVNEEPAQ